MSMSDYCDFCGKPSKIHVGSGKSGKYKNYCLDCHNKLMAEFTDTDLPDIIPKLIYFVDGDGTSHTFEIEFMLNPSCKTLEANEVGATSYKSDVYGELDEDFSKMWETLISQIEKMLSVKYMNPDGYFKGDKAAGYVEYNCERDANDIIIDGKPYTWQELEQNVSAHEGFKIRIEFGDVGEKFD